jgi:hypothetical protein
LYTHAREAAISRERNPGPDILTHISVPAILPEMPVLGRGA